jgi:hypothetical protein
LKYAPVLVVDYQNQRWKIVGVLVHNRHHIALLKVDEEDQAIRGDLSFKALVDSYNEQFEEGGLSFYEMGSEEMSSHLGKLSTSDAEFVAKFRDKLAEGRSTMMAIGEIFEYDSENVLEHIDRLLAEVKEGNKRVGPPKTTGG